MTMESSVTAHPAGASSDERIRRIHAISEAAYRARHHAIDMGEVQGQGYVGQALGAADIMATVYVDQLRVHRGDPTWEGRDRFLLSIGHYAIGLYAALAEAGIIPVEELVTYAADDSRLPMSAMASYTPGVEISGGSLGHGLTVAVGMALGLRLQGHDDQRVINLLSDGELDEGATWEAAMSAASHQLGNLTALVDVNALQADGPTAEVLRIEPIHDKWTAFGWRVVRIDGNDPAALIDAFDECNAHRSAMGQPQVILCDTRVGKGVPLIENREKTHFMRIEEDEWAICRAQLTEGYEKETR